MYNLRIQRQRLFVLAASLIGFFCFLIAMSVESAVGFHHHNCVQLTTASAPSSVAFGSIDSLYNSLLSKMRHKNLQIANIACRRSLKQDIVYENDETCFDTDVQKASLFGFDKLQKLLMLSLLFASSAPTITSDEQLRRSSVTCFTLPAAVEAQVCPLIERCPSDYSLCVGLSTNACAASIAHYSTSQPAAFATACALSGCCGYLEGILPDQNHQGYVRSYSTSYPADQVCIPAGNFWQGDPLANAAACGSVGYYVGRGAGVFTKKFCCTKQQNCEVVVERPVMHLPIPQYIEREDATTSRGSSVCSKTSIPFSQFIAERSIFKKSIRRTKSFNNIFDIKKN